MLTTEVAKILPSNLDQIAHDYAPLFWQAAPFPHIVLDNFLDEQVAQKLALEFQTEKWQPLVAEGLCFKYSSGGDNISEFARHALEELNGAAMLQFLAKLTGVKGLLNDPAFNLRGLQSAKASNFMEIHADQNYNANLAAFRSLNLLLYLTPDWREEYNGHLELWDAEMTAPVKKVLPVFNRCIIFAHGDTHYHGYPVPIACPPHLARNLVNLAYYTKEPSQEHDPIPRGTLWQKRPSNNKPVSLARPDLSPEQQLKLLEREVRLITKERDSLSLRLGEVIGTLRAFTDSERNSLIHRVSTAEQHAGEIALQLERVQAELNQTRLIATQEREKLVLEFGHLQQWASELEQRLKQTENKKPFNHLFELFKRRK
jgi:2OG-Fe(II) oxygenase superfamily